MHGQHCKMQGVVYAPMGMGLTFDGDTEIDKMDIHDDAFLIRSIRRGKKAGWIGNEKKNMHNKPDAFEFHLDSIQTWPSR